LSSGEFIMPDPKPPQEHPLANILLNVLIPVMVLDHLSKDPAIQTLLGKEVKFWHIGPVKAIILALALPLGYGIWHYLKTRKFNVFSALGFISVLLTGGLTFYLWNQDGTVKPNAGLLFGLKEASIPLALAAAVIFSQRTATPLIRTFLYSDSIFDIPRIERRVAERDAGEGYARLLRQATWLFAGSFLLSSGLNLGLAWWFFRGFEAGAIDALERYNQIVSRITWWGFVAIGAPLLVMLFVILTRLLKGLRELTGLDDKDLMHPR
jgi:hypothetical protein